MAPLKEFQGNFASSSMPNFQPQMDFGYEIIPWLAGSFIVFVIGLIVRQISTSFRNANCHGLTERKLIFYMPKNQGW